MAFDPAIPLATDSPSVFPAQSQGNFAQLQSIITADHQFNLVSAANDGWHNLVHLQQQSPASSALAAVGRLYGKTFSGRVHLAYMDSAGVEYQITPGMPIRASVNFTGGAVPVINSQYNVLSVTRPSAGVYLITFLAANPMPNTNYIVHVTGQATSGTAQANIVGGIATGAVMLTTSVTVQFTSGSTPAFTDPLIGCVTIFSVT